MRAFAELYAILDATTSTNARLAALQAYFGATPAQDAAWAVYFLAGGKPRQLVPTKVLREFTQQAAGIPEWLFDECYHSVGDLAETIALLLPESGKGDDQGLAAWMATRLLPLRGADPVALRASLKESFGLLDSHGRFVFAKLITGSMRIGVSRLLVTRALAAVAGIDPKRMAQRLMGYTDRAAEPSAATFEALLAPESEGEAEFAAGQPYPFFLAHPLQADVATFEATLGQVTDWQVEWKWDGIRAQVVQRSGSAWVWSRGEELVTDRFPELADMAGTLLPGTVLDGEIVVWQEGKVCPFARLQKRLGRKNVTTAVLRDQPVVLLAYDVLEWQGRDWRQRSQHERRAALEEIVGAASHPALQLSPLLHETSWTALAACRDQARERGVEGLMLKARNAHYGVGRTRDVGVWWKWKVDPFSVDAVLLYAQPGHGRRANLYTDYTFAVWNGPPQDTGRTLVPFAKAYSGLTDEEIRKVDAIVRRTTVEKFGPVRSLRPTLVFELGFEGISHSPRHKSGVAVRFPRMLRWRHDKPVQEADSLDTLKMLLPA